MPVSDDDLIERLALRERLRIDPEQGLIQLGDARMLLLHARALGALRRELFNTLGQERARPAGTHGLRIRPAGCRARQAPGG